MMSWTRPFLLVALLTAVAPRAPAGETPASRPANAPVELRKLMDVPLRDPSICVGPDGAYYLKNTFWLTYSMPGWDNTARTSGSGLLKSTSGKHEGPYVDMQPAERMGDEIDATLFQDDDGRVYFAWHSGKIARLKSDMSGLAEPYHWLKSTVSDSDPNHHSGLCAGIFGKDSFDHVGYEGMFLFKRGGLYYLCCSDQIDGRYSCMIATSKNLLGPYSARYEAIRHGGHNAFFADPAGQWWSTFFGPPYSERAAVLPVHFDVEGRLRPGRE